jgi:hypothetical protein
MADRNVRVVNNNGLKPQTEKRLKTASTAFDKNSLVEFASGVINPSDDNDTVVHGIILEDVASTDSDYATTGNNAGKLVEILRPTDEVEIDFSGGAVTVGTAYGISNAYNVDAADTSNKVFTVTKDLSGGATSGRCRGFFKTYAGANAL